MGDDTIDASGLHGLPVEFDGGAGNDTITLGSGSSTSVQSTITGGTGDDTIVVNGGGNLSLEGGDGDDTISAGSGTSDVDGGAGNDTINGGGAGPPTASPSSAPSGSITSTSTRPRSST